MKGHQHRFYRHPTEQIAIAEFLKGGHFEPHLRRIVPIPAAIVT